MAPFSDEYLFVEIANKVCIWLELYFVLCLMFSLQSN